MLKPPVISVVMPFYNSAETIVRALKSIFRQTMRDFEIVAIDDGSTDDSYHRVKVLYDPRIRLFRNERNLGVAATRNRALDLVGGTFLTFMDADDTSHPKRLEWTLNAMHANHDVGVCGGWMRVYRRGALPYVMRQPCRPAAIKAMYLLGNPFCYSSILIRRELIVDHAIRYCENLKTGEDHDFCTRLMRHTQGMNIPRVIYDYRWNPGGLTANAGPESVTRRIAQFQLDLEQVLGKRLSDQELRFHAQIGNGAGAADKLGLEHRRDWLEKILSANLTKRQFDPEGLAEAIAMIWFRICRNSVHLGPAAWRIWRQATFATHYRPTADEMLGLAGSMLKARLLHGSAKPQGGLPE